MGRARSPGTGARGTAPPSGQGEGRQARCVRRVPQGPTGGGRRGARGALLGRQNTRGSASGVTGRAGVEAAPAAAADTSDLASCARHTTVPSPSPCAPLQRLAPMRSSSARRARPRPPALALPHAGPESLFHFSFSDEDTCWHPPGRSVRWVARGQSPPFPPEGSDCWWGCPVCLGESPKWFSGSTWSPNPFSGPKRLGTAQGFLQVASKMGAGSCPLSAYPRWDPFSLCTPKPGLLAFTLAASMGVQGHLGSTPGPPASSQVPGPLPFLSPC